MTPGWNLNLRLLKPWQGEWKLENCHCKVSNSLVCAKSRELHTLFFVLEKLPGWYLYKCKDCNPKQKMFETGSKGLGAKATVNDNVCAVGSNSSVEWWSFEKMFSFQGHIWNCCVAGKLWLFVMEECECVLRRCCQGLSNSVLEARQLFARAKLQDSGSGSRRCFET